MVSANCETKTFSYLKMIVFEGEFAEGWQVRNQASHTQFHCNKDGMATKTAWLVTLDEQRETNSTTPKACGWGHFLPCRPTVSDFVSSLMAQVTDLVHTLGGYRRRASQ
jgi:hypothetical protein